MTDRDRKLAMADEFRRLAVSRQRHADKLSDEAQALHREADAIEAEARASPRRHGQKGTRRWRLTGIQHG